jgi:hypothetical protein
MNFKTVYSTKQNIDVNIEEIKKNLMDFDAKAILYFCSSTFVTQGVAEKMHNAFSNVQTFGCTTSGELVSGKMLDGSLVAMAFTKEAIIDMKIEVVENLKPKIDLEPALTSFEKHFGLKVIEMEPQKYVGIILIDGLSGAEEQVMDQLGDKCNFTFIGGSAGDDLKFEKTYVFANGKSFSNAALLALLKPGLKFDFLKTQSFKNLNKQLIATEVDEVNRVIKKINNKPAVYAYAEALGINKEQLQAELFAHPLGLIVDNEPYVRSPQSILDDGEIKFYCNVKEGTELTLLESNNIITDTAKDLEDKKNQLGNIRAVINFNCILRTLELKNKSQTEKYGQLFSSLPTIGFSTYGEEFIGHINQTATMLVFSDN